MFIADNNCEKYAHTRRNRDISFLCLFSSLSQLPHNAAFRFTKIYSCDKQFLFFSQCFLPYVTLIFHFKCTLKCRLQFVSVWTSLNFCRLVIGKFKYVRYDFLLRLFLNNFQIVADFGLLFLYFSDAIHFCQMFRASSLWNWQPQVECICG